MCWFDSRFVAIRCLANILGFITRGRGVTVNTWVADCARRAIRSAIDVSWEENKPAAAPAGKDRMTCVDQPGLLAAISAAITSADANIARAQIHTYSKQKAVNTFEVMIKNSEHLQEVLRNVSTVKGVYKAVRARGRTGGKAEAEEIAKQECVPAAMQLFHRRNNDRCRPTRVCYPNWP